MRLLRTGLRVLAVALVAVASGVAVNQVLNGGQWNVRWLAAAVRTWPRSTHSTDQRRQHRPRDPLVALVLQAVD